jgi:pyruvate,water dikinase
MNEFEYVNFLNNTEPLPQLLGGKGSNLVKLINFKLNVPPGFVVNTKSYQNFIECSDVGEKINDLNFKDLPPKDILKISAEIQDEMLKTEIPIKICREISISREKICKEIGNDQFFAVRSSATIEDSVNFSFAGQADTYLYNNTLEDILISLKNCWSSLFSTRAFLYFLQMKKKGITFSFDDIHMAVIVQKMVNSDVSGVLFTINVINNNRNQMLINSSWGLGETIANNSISPDSIVLKKSKFEIIKINIGEKEKRAVQNPNGCHTILIDNEPNLKITCSLNDKDLYRLYELGLKLEKNFKYPQDIEWAFEKNILYVLQTRPITTLKK